MSRVKITSYEQFESWLTANKPQLATAIGKAEHPMTGEIVLSALEALVAEILDLERDIAEAKKLNARIDDILKRDYGSVVPGGRKINVRELGEAKATTGGLYLYGVADVDQKNENAPFVQNKRTKRMFHMPWNKIVKMAVEAGLDDEQAKIIIPT